MDGDLLPADIRDEMAATMRDKVGVFREKGLLSEAYSTIKDLREKFKRIKVRHKGKRLNMDLIWTLELKGNLDVAEAVVSGALTREESRGSHFRTDFPTRDDGKWLKHTLARFTEAGAKLDYSEVKLGKWEPKERKY
jgi:succinate dehydrogenase / fumarate reductase flavoprotein subunit